MQSNLSNYKQQSTSQQKHFAVVYVSRQENLAELPELLTQATLITVSVL